MMIQRVNANTPAQAVKSRTGPAEAPSDSPNTPGKDRLRRAVHALNAASKDYDRRSKIQDDEWKAALNDLDRAQNRPISPSVACCPPRPNEELLALSPGLSPEELQELKARPRPTIKELLALSGSGSPARSPRR